MNCEACRETLGDFTDDLLAPAERAAVGQHLAACEACASLAADLRRIRLAAAGLERHSAPAGVWRRVEDGIARRQAARARVARAWRVGALAACAVLALATGAFYATRQPVTGNPASASTTTAPSTPSEGAGSGPDLVQSIEEELRLAEQHYERAIAGLEEAARTDQETLDPQLAGILQKNMTVIDQAIAESRAAVRAQPTSQPARESLFEAFRNKVALLQATISLVNEMRKGDETGTARVMGELAR